MKDISNEKFIVYSFSSPDDLYEWMVKNHAEKSYFFAPVQLGNPEKHKNSDKLLYIDLVYTLLCFGWIDGWQKKIDGNLCSRCSPRVKNSPWTEQNKIRCEMLIKQNKMHPAGLQAYEEGKRRNLFKIHPLVLEVINFDDTIKKNFYSFPEEYQRIRINNIQSRMDKDMDGFYKRLDIFKQKTKAGLMYGLE